ncbi:2-succinyl-5-enolpyruvyl-6-hydroxy-3-cyclohexene-1-carboxylate synthase [Lishizhenia tianjinensis]|uniref:2-succinyl-5-enolpyruvyl-6-hydroxy-3-cyclohexene-1-carboxylate synthase n=1 Tax=Lishizhenia tianjinensis TaxID=477690 RepID=A0A1I6YYK9_9FLAO|nr:2-succinyl-5-enolpyruvyl-6-hydroxy-3-cyclohexene-1-carboxylic-acid synthase [Lishizhenia tianjinensis]SFT55593.1 2-succinyl-5-enolpyruvyl-6-hydroxy-3-cyclohexene-1-carboxylate synthase [Lishizhenia tianjinensis]
MSKTGVKYFVEQCKLNNLRNVVISPGSRNAPLTIAFSSDDFFKCISIPDERSAAFVALGMAEQLQEPVAVLCTSGSALLNYAPAVSEAFYRSIPLVVISADRPNMWVDQGDGQTIRQTNALANHVRFETELKEHLRDDNEVWELCRKTDHAFQVATQAAKGPVHINFPFTEPLYDSSEVAYTPQKHLNLVAPKMTFDAHQLEHFQNIWDKTQKRMIIVGQMPVNPKVQAQLVDLATDTSTVVLVENTSNCTHRSFIQCIDRTLNSISAEQEEDFAPDLLITIGGAVVSKRIKAFIRRNKIQHHWKVSEDFNFMDTYQKLTASFPMKAEQFFEEMPLTKWSRNSNNYGGKWKQLDLQIQAQHDAYFYDAPYADMSVFEMLLDYIPENSVLHFSNSSVIRYAQLFDAIPSIERYCNRGTSGIDGSTSTAVGAALARPDKLHTLITGDISFFYDSNALWNKVLPSNLRIFLINNEGGGIFKIIPGPGTTQALDEFFTTRHQTKAEHLCKAYEVNYFKADNLQAIDGQMEDFYAKLERPAIMEIFTPYEENDKVLKAYFDFVKVK